MLKRLRLLLSLPSKGPPLSELDTIYHKAISQLPAGTKKEYCERLINRTTFELRQTKCNYEIQKLNQLIKAAKQEVSKLTIKK